MTMFYGMRESQGPSQLRLLTVLLDALGNLQAIHVKKVDVNTRHSHLSCKTHRFSLHLQIMGKSSSWRFNFSRYAASFSNVSFWSRRRVTPLDFACGRCATSRASRIDKHKCKYRKRRSMTSDQLRFALIKSQKNCVIACVHDSSTTVWPRSQRSDSRTLLFVSLDLLTMQHQLALFDLDNRTELLYRILSNIHQNGKRCAKTIVLYVFM